MLKNAGKKITALSLLQDVKELPLFTGSQDRCVKYKLKLVGQIAGQRIHIGFIDLFSFSSHLLNNFNNSNNPAIHMIMNSLMLNQQAITMDQITEKDQIFFISNIYIKSILRSQGFGTTLMEHLQRWLNEHSNDFTLFVNSADITEEVAGKLKLLDKESLDYHISKHRFKGWLTRFGFNSIEEDCDLMLMAERSIASSNLSVA